MGGEFYFVEKQIDVLVHFLSVSGIQRYFTSNFLVFRSASYHHVDHMAAIDFSNACMIGNIVQVGGGGGESSYWLHDTFTMENMV